MRDSTGRGGQAARPGAHRRCHAARARPAHAQGLSAHVRLARCERAEAWRLDKAQDRS